MKRLPIGMQTFSKLIEKECIYVDKTDLIYTMISEGKYYFLSRPRRFGKSLLVSTLAAIFSGNKELFAGLAMSSLPYNWKKYSVVMISFADIPFANPQALEKGIKNYLQEIAHRYGILLDFTFTPGEMLRSLVIELAKTAPVALLIDEYDYPILQHIHNDGSVREMREVLKGFYSVVKGLDPYLEFCFLTGVSKFSQASIFSGLNNLNDISFDRTFNTLLGYTNDEIMTYFQPYLLHAADYNKCSLQEIVAEMTEWYDGYLFTSDKHAVKMYNPYSVLLFLSKQVFSHYWFTTGTPTFLVNLFKKYHYPVQDFEGAEATETELNTFELENISLKTLLFQTGYLTLAGVNPHNRNYILTYPNKEAVDGLFQYIFASMTHQAPS